MTQSEHFNISFMHETCSISCHRLMTMVGAWKYIIHLCHMLCQLLSSHGNGQSMAIYPSCIKHAPSVVIVSWQRSEHGYSSLRYETCSVSCHRLLTTVRTWWFIHQVWNMLCQLSSSNDNVQSMVIYPFCMNHAPSDVIISWQRSEHVYISFMYETCSVSCLRLMTTDRAWLYIPKVWNMLLQLSSSRDNGQSMAIYPFGINHAPSVIVSWKRSNIVIYHLSMKHAPPVVIVS